MSSDGLVVTNDHVVAMAPTVALLSDGTERKVLGLLATDPIADVAVLRIEGSGYAPLVLGASVSPVRGDEVVIIGSPLGFDQSVSEGIVAALWPDGLPDQSPQSQIARYSLLQVTAAISPGSSGSPVFNAEGRVVAVAQSVAGAGYGASAGFAVDISAVTALLGRAPPSGELAQLPSTLRSLSLSLGVVAGVVAFGVAPAGWSWARRRQRERAARAERLRARRGG